MLSNVETYNITVLLGLVWTDGGLCVVCVWHMSLYLVVDIDDCVGVDCGAGTCVDGVNTQTCDCDVGFTGDNCQTSKLYN